MGEEDEEEYGELRAVDPDHTCCVVLVENKLWNLTISICKALKGLVRKIGSIFLFYRTAQDPLLPLQSPTPSTTIITQPLLLHTPAPLISSPTTFHDDDDDDDDRPSVCDDRLLLWCAEEIYRYQYQTIDHHVAALDIMPVFVEENEIPSLKEEEEEGTKEKKKEKEKEDDDKEKKDEEEKTKKKRKKKKQKGKGKEMEKEEEEPTKKKWQKKKKEKEEEEEKEKQKEEEETTKKKKKKEKEEGKEKENEKEKEMEKEEEEPKKKKWQKKKKEKEEEEGKGKEKEKEKKEQRKKKKKKEEEGEEKEKEKEKENEGKKKKSIIMVVEERWIKHYSSSHRILLVGEGNFSFSACLAKAFRCASNIIATSLDSEAFLKEQYRDALSNIEELRSRGSKVLHGIDAATMANPHLLRQLKFDRIVFNFPYAGLQTVKSLPRQTQLEHHRRLVSQFMENAREMIEEGEIHITHKTNGFHGEWWLESLARGWGLMLIEAVDFELHGYPGYNTKCGFGGDNYFYCYPSKTYKFGLASHD